MFLNKFQSQIKVAIVVFVATVVFYLLYIGTNTEGSSEQNGAVLFTPSSAGGGAASSHLGRNAGASSFGSSARNDQIYGVKVIPADLSDESLNMLPKDTFSYACVIDAGSSGSRVHVYRYGKLGSLGGALYVLPNHQSYKEKPGLSSFADHPADAASSMIKLVDFMKANIPESQWGYTPLFLKATAGMRMLTKDQQAAVMGSVQDYLSDKAKTPFIFKRNWAQIIPGTYEGGFGWISYNYLKKVIGPKRPVDGTAASPYAVVEMGGKMFAFDLCVFPFFGLPPCITPRHQPGASAQVTAMAQAGEISSIPDNDKFSLNIAGQSYTLYTHSYLGYGGEQAREMLTKSLEPKADLVKDPCLQTGFTRSRDVARADVFGGTADTSVAVEGDSGLHISARGGSLFLLLAVF